MFIDTSTFNPLSRERKAARPPAKADRLRVPKDAERIVAPPPTGKIAPFNIDPAGKRPSLANPNPPAAFWQVPKYELIAAVDHKSKFAPATRQKSTPRAFLEKLPGPQTVAPALPVETGDDDVEMESETEVEVEPPPRRPAVPAAVRPLREVHAAPAPPSEAEMRAERLAQELATTRAGHHAAIVQSTGATESARQEAIAQAARASAAELRHEAADEARRTSDQRLAEATAKHAQEMVELARAHAEERRASAIHVHETMEQRRAQDAAAHAEVIGGLQAAHALSTMNEKHHTERAAAMEAHAAGLHASLVGARRDVTRSKVALALRRHVTQQLTLMADHAKRGAEHERDSALAQREADRKQHLSAAQGSSESSMQLLATHRALQQRLAESEQHRAELTSRFSAREAELLSHGKALANQLKEADSKFTAGRFSSAQHQERVKALEGQVRELEGKYTEATALHDDFRAREAAFAAQTHKLTAELETAQSQAISKSFSKAHKDERIRHLEEAIRDLQIKNDHERAAHDKTRKLVGRPRSAKPRMMIKARPASAGAMVVHHEPVGRLAKRGRMDAGEYDDEQGVDRPSAVSREFFDYIRRKGIVPTERGTFIDAITGVPANPKYIAELRAELLEQMHGKHKEHKPRGRGGLAGPSQQQHLGSLAHPLRLTGPASQKMLEG